jgi:hypothetical protein
LDLGLTEPRTKASLNDQSLEWTGAVGNGTSRPKSLSDIQLEGIGDEQEWDFRVKRSRWSQLSTGGAIFDSENIPQTPTSHHKLRQTTRLGTPNTVKRTRTPLQARNRMQEVAAIIGTPSQPHSPSLKKEFESTPSVTPVR